MSTVINNPTPSERTIVETDSSGWAVAVIVLLLVFAAGIYAWLHYREAAPAPQQPGATINVTLPVGDNNANHPSPSPTTQ